VKDVLVEVEEAGTGLEKTAVVEGTPFVVVGVPAFNEKRSARYSKTISRLAAYYACV